MNRYITNFPKEPYLAHNESTDEIILMLRSDYGVVVPKKEHERLLNILPDNSLGMNIYTSVIMLLPHLRAFLETDLMAIRESRETANRILKAMDEKKFEEIRFDYQNGELCDASVKVRLGSRSRSFEVPQFLINNRFVGMDFVLYPSIKEDDFSLILQKGTRFQETKIGISNALHYIYDKYKGKKTSCVEESFKWQFLPYLNCLYEYVKQNINLLTRTQTPLQYTAMVLGCPDLEEKFYNIIGRGKKKMLISISAEVIRKTKIEEISLEERYSK